MSFYPCSLWSPTTKTNKVDLVDASHINTAQEEIVAMQRQLQKALDSDGTILSGTSFTSPSYGISQLFFRTDIDTLYIKGSTGWIAQGGSLSNVLFQYQASTDLASANQNGELQASTLTDTASTALYRYMSTNGTSLTTVLSTKWTKISGVSTITIYAQLWTSSSNTATLKVNIGSANNSTTRTSTTPGWVTFTIDVTGLSNGTTYDVTYQISTDNAGNRSYLGTLIAFGS